MAMIGADVEALRSLAVQLNTKAGEIDNLVAVLTRQLDSVQWVGNDATRFRNDWTSQHTVALKQVATALRTAGTQVTTQAGKQVSASA